MFYPILAWSFWVTRRDRWMGMLALIIPAAAYGLTAFWLVPSYFRITAGNMKYVGSPADGWSVASAVAVAAAYVTLTWRLANRRPERTWAIFIAGCVLFFSLNIIGNYFFNFRISGDPHRWIPELDVVYILGGVTVLQWMWNSSGRVPQIAVAVIVLAAFFTTKSYIFHAWHIFPADPNYQGRIEYQIPKWLSQNIPGARFQTEGSVRFWFDVWHDLAQMTGGSDQGLINGVTMDAQYVIRVDPNPEASVLWLQCLGVDAVYVAEPGSQYYNLLPSLRAYADAIEKGPERPITLEHDGPDAMRVRARLSPGQSIVVQESCDPAWHAWSGRVPLRVRKDAMGFMIIDAPPGEQEVRLQFITPLENRVGRVITPMTLLIMVWWLCDLPPVRRQ